MADILTREFVPQELLEKPYIKEAGWLDKPWGKETAAEIFKKLDGAESLLGKRPQIPGKDAKPEDLEKFFGQFAEEKPEGYEIPLTEGEPVDETFVKAVKSAFHAGKINKVQAAGFLKVMTEHGNARKQAIKAAQAKAELEFDTTAKAALGEKNKEVMARVKQALTEHVPAVYRGQLEKLDDKSLLIMTATIDAIMQKFIPADKLNAKPGDGGAGGAGDSKSKREEAKKLMATKAYTNWQDPEHEATVAKVNLLYKEAAGA